MNLEIDKSSMLCKKNWLTKFYRTSHLTDGFSFLASIKKPLGCIAQVLVFNSQILGQNGAFRCAAKLDQNLHILKINNVGLWGFTQVEVHLILIIKFCNQLFL